MKDNETVSDFGSSFWILLFHTLGCIAMHSIGCGLLPHHVVWLCVCWSCCKNGRTDRGAVWNGRHKEPCTRFIHWKGHFLWGWYLGIPRHVNHCSWSCQCPALALTLALALRLWSRPLTSWPWHKLQGNMIIQYFVQQSFSVLLWVGIYWSVYIPRVVYL